MSQPPDNPYRSPAAEQAPATVWYRRWPVVAGGVCLLVATLCVTATVLGMVRSFGAIAHATTPPDPSELASGVSGALLFAIPAIPLGIAGCVLLIVGLAFYKG